MTEVLNEEVAREEVDKWLDAKNVSKNKRQSVEDHVEILVEAFQEGYLERQEDDSLHLTLRVPLGEDGDTNSLTFKKRLNRNDLEKYMKGVKADDADNRIVAYIAALTGQPKGVIKKLDSEDQRIADSIAVFFLS